MTKTRTKQAEDTIYLYLQNNYKVLERNWKSKSGEATIIFLDGEEIVFADVKARASTATGLPEMGIASKRRHEMEQIAIEYLFGHELPSMRIRFDCFAVAVAEDGKAILGHHRDVFGV